MTQRKARQVVDLRHQRVQARAEARELRRRSAGRRRTRLELQPVLDLANREHARNTTVLSSIFVKIIEFAQRKAHVHVFDGN